MARPSKRKDRQGTSVFLVVLFAILMGIAIAVLGHREYRTALVLAGLAWFFLSILLTVTWPTKCRVMTRQGTPCKYDAYGFVFGCSQYHFWDKLWARFGVAEREAITREAPRGQQAMSYAMPPPGAQPVKVTIVEGARDKLGFWVNVSAAALAAAQVLIAIYALH